MQMFLVFYLVLKN